jgi:hypothetical protein
MFSATTTSATGIECGSGPKSAVASTGTPVIDLTSTSADCMGVAMNCESGPVADVGSPAALEGPTLRSTVALGGTDPGPPVPLKPTPSVPSTVQPHHASSSQVGDGGMTFHALFVLA